MAIPIKTHISGDTGLINGPLNKLWGAKILLNRTISPHSKVSKGTSDPIPNPKIKTTKFTENLQAVERDRIEALVKKQVMEGTPLYKADELNPQNISNNIIIINPNTSPPQSLVIQGKPQELKVNPESSWATVKSMGRNNPFMMYTGGEDTLEFDISWYAMDPDRRDVIDKCRILESWSKADGYNSSPPALMISWGSSDLFQDDYWVLTNASYVLSNFQNACRLGTRRDTQGFMDLGLYPNVATQSLTFKKVTWDNTTHEIIQKPDNRVASKLSMEG